MKPRPFSSKLRAEDVGTLINFGVDNHSAQAAMHNIQTQGAAAIWNMLTERDFAYLADEVGMGKTYQALGIMSLLWNFNPKARVVIVCPRNNLQNKWARDYTNFVRHNYRPSAFESGDDRVKSILLDEPVIDAVKCDNLRDFAEQLQSGVDGQQLFILRHTSFTRPLNITEDDMTAPVRAWREQTDKMAQYGIHLDDRTEEIKRLKTEGKDRLKTEGKDLYTKFNEWFGLGVNKILANFEHSGREKAIDLLIVDEAQCLRNKNQRNATFEHLFKGRVGKTLFLSATPIHSGRINVKSVINKYGEPDFFTKEDVDDSTLLRAKLKKVMIRRPREYDVTHGGENGGPAKWTKDKYRHHNEEASKIIYMSPLESLVMATVQKNLVKILGAKNNRFKIGCLSCFESLQDSVYNSRKLKKDTASREVATALPDSNRLPDIYTSHNDKETREIKKTGLPDMRFVDKLSISYLKTFGRKIPHPKVDFMVRQLTEHSIRGGYKFVVFTRRINTVDGIVNNLNKEHDKWVLQHIKAAWGYDFSQLPGLSRLDKEAPTSGDDESEANAGNSLLARSAHKGRWLYKYRQTFKESGRNALMFEENWFRFFAESRALNIADICKNIPGRLWAESREFAIRSKNTANPKIFPADRYHYLLVQTVRRHPEILGLDRSEADKWLAFFSKRYPDALKIQEEAGRTEARMENLITFIGFWDVLRSRQAIDTPVKEVFGKLYLSIDPENIKSLYHREITKSCVWQSIRLGETLFDLYCADIKQPDITAAASTFIDYLLTNPAAALLKKQTKEWIDQIEVIILNSLSGDGQSLQQLAEAGKYSELNNPQFAVGMVGGDTNKTALSQFKTPGYPRVLVCTDILKEGEDLHIFCDKVVHYGVAWTSGDLEQRVGRVDRYFSQIERRLLASLTPDKEQLEILYPHLVNSIEKRQINMVMERVKDAEMVLDDIGEESLDESKDVNLDINPRLPVRLVRTGNQKFFAPDFTGVPSFNLEQTFSSNFKVTRNKYLEIHRRIAEEFHSRQYLTDPGSVIDQFSSRIYLKNDRNNFDCIWNFVPSIHKYSFRIRRAVQMSEITSSGPLCEYYERSGKDYKSYIEQRVIIDGNALPEQVIKAIHSAFDSLNAPEVAPIRDDAGALMFKAVLNKKFGMVKHSGHRCKIKLKLCGRVQKCRIHFHENSFTVLSLVVPASMLNLCSAYEINAKLNFGFLYLEDDEWYFCERVFHSGLDPDSTAAIVERVTHIAHQYRLKHLGK